MVDLVLFGSSYCPPCMALKEFFVENGFAFSYVDVYQDQQTAVLHEVSSVPVVFVDGQRIDQPTPLTMKNILKAKGDLK
jgi:glutaredoxin